MRALQGSVCLEALGALEIDPTQGSRSCITNLRPHVKQTLLRSSP